MYLVYSGLFNRLRRYYFAKLIERCGLGRSSVVLDYGCGPGDLLHVCKEMGIAAEGVDSYERSVLLALQRGLSVKQADFSSLPFEKESFDAIILQSVIEHVSNPIEMLQTLTAYLAPGGMLVVSAPTPGAHFWDDPTHVRPFTPQSFKVIGDLIGLQVVEINYVFSFLLGIRLRWSMVYKLMNLVPASLGSNIVALYRKNG